MYHNSLTLLSSNQHLSPWKNGYSSAHLTFILGSSLRTFFKINLQKITTEKSAVFLGWDGKIRAWVIKAVENHEKTITEVCCEYQQKTLF
jgi:hypothetical protein